MISTRLRESVDTRIRSKVVDTKNSMSYKGSRSVPSNLQPREAPFSNLVLLHTSASSWSIDEPSGRTNDSPSRTPSRNTVLESSLHPRALRSHSSPASSPPSWQTILHGTVISIRSCLRTRSTSTFFGQLMRSRGASILPRSTTVVSKPHAAPPEMNRIKHDRFFRITKGVPPCIGLSRMMYRPFCHPRTTVRYRAMFSICIRTSIPTERYCSMFSRSVSTCTDVLPLIDCSGKRHGRYHP